MESLWQTVLKPTLIVALVCFVLALLQAGAIILGQVWLAIGLPVIIIAAWIIAVIIIDKITRIFKGKDPHDPCPWR